MFLQNYYKGTDEPLLNWAVIMALFMEQYLRSEYAHR